MILTFISLRGLLSGSLPFAFLCTHRYESKPNAYVQAEFFYVDKPSNMDLAASHARDGKIAATTTGDHE